MKLLHIDSSIQGEASASRAVSRAIVDEIRAAELGTEIVYRDLAADPIGHLTLADWGGPEAEAILEEFLAADTVVIGAGFYNFTVPSQLKAWIDRICIPGRTFAYSEAGPEGLVKGKRVIVAIAKGGFYGAGTPTAGYEHGETLLRSIFGFIGADVEVVAAEGLRRGDDIRDASMAAAFERAKAIGAERLAA